MGSPVLRNQYLRPLIPGRAIIVHAAGRHCQRPSAVRRWWGPADLAYHGSECARLDEDPMPYRLIALDLDGTLLDSQHRLSPANRATVADCLAAGAQVLLATGRVFHSARPYARELGLRGPQITLNGAVLADAASGRLTTRAGMSRDQLALVLDALAARGLPYVVYGAAETYAEPGTPAAHLALLESYGEPSPRLLARTELLRLDAPIKVLSFLRPGPLDAELAAELGAAVEVMRTGPNFFEFLFPGVSKGAALAELIELAGIPPAEVLAIGDGENDISMFGLAGMSVAMGGAAPAVRAAARAATADCDADGVALALRRYVLAQGRLAEPYAA